MVGVHYGNSETPEFFAQSAQDVYDLLTSPDYGMCDPERSKLIKIKKGDTLSYSELREQINHMVKSLKLGEEWIFFFSGHAKVNPGINQPELYLCLSDSTQENWDTWFPYSEVTETLNRFNKNKSIVILDACESSAMFDGYSISGNMCLMAACKKNEFARQISAFKRTVFSYYFCEGIIKGQNITTKHIYVTDLQNYINSQIKQHHNELQQEVQIKLQQGNPLWISLNPSYLGNSNSHRETSQDNTNQAMKITPHPNHTNHEDYNTLQTQLKNATIILQVLEEKAALHAPTQIPEMLLVDLRLKRNEVEQLKKQLNKLEGDHD